MLNFLSDNLGTIIVGAIVLTILVLAIIKIIKDKKNHKTCCGSSCSGCPNNNDCHKS